MSYDEYENIESSFDIAQVKDKERQQYLKDLFAIERQIKELNRQKVNTLASLAEDGKSERIYDAMLKVHKGILESDGSESVSDIISSSLETEEELTLLLENRNAKFYKSSEVFDEFKDHPEQKSLVKKKHINKRGIKKQKTPSQHISYVKDAKDTQSRLMRMELELLKMQQKVDLQNAKLVELEIKQTITESKLDNVDRDLSCLATDLCNKVDDVRKLTAYLMYTEKGMSVENISEVMQVPKRTLYRWIKTMAETH